MQTRKAGAAHKVLKFDKNSVTVDRDGFEDKFSKERVTRAPSRPVPTPYDHRKPEAQRRRGNV